MKRKITSTLYEIRDTLSVINTNVYLIKRGHHSPRLLEQLEQAVVTLDKQVSALIEDTVPQ